MIFTWMLFMNAFMNKYCIVNSNYQMRDQEFPLSLQNISLNTYHHVKIWYELTKEHEFSLPEEKNMIDKVQLYYAYSFKQIFLQEKFVSHHLKQIGNCANNGLIIVANIYDEAEQYYLGKPFQQKGLFCQPNVNQNYIESLEQIILSFYIISQKNIVKFGYCFIINFQLVNNEGQIFDLGIIKHNLNQRPKSAVQTLTLQKEGKQVGFVQCIIDTPDRLFLSEMLPPFRIINQETVIPPCTKISLLNKVNPLKIGEGFPISILSLYGTIENVSKMLSTLKQKTTLYNRYHSSDISMQIKDYYVLIGYHNSWQFVVSHTSNNSKLIEKNKSGKVTKKQFHKIKLIHQMKTDDTLLLSFKQNEIAQLDYYHVEGGQIICILAASVNFQVESTITHNQDQLLYLGWSPLIFNIMSEKSTTQLPMINSVSIPNYPIASQSLQIILRVTVSNINPGLHKIGKKTNIQASEKPFNKLVDDLEEDLKQTVHYNLQKGSKSKISTSKWLENKDFTLEENIVKLVKYLEKKTNKKLKLEGTSFFIPPSQTQPPLQRNSLLKKTCYLSILFQSYLPHTNHPESYYVPRSMTITVYFLREIYNFDINLDGNQIDYGIQVPLLNNKNNKTPSYYREIHIPSFEDYRKLQESFLICQIFDTQNHLFYAKVNIPSLSCFTQSPSRSKATLYSPENYQFGSLMIQSSVQVKNLITNTNKIQELEIQQIYKNLPMRERLMLRIANYQNSHLASSKKNQAISEYKQLNRQEIVNKISEEQYGNDLQIQYEIGKPIYYWLSYNNENKSENNLFTIQISGCEFMEIVTEKKEFEREQAKANEGKKAKGSINYIIGTNYVKGHYEVRIKHGSQIDLLLKIAQNQWLEKMQQTKLVHIVLKRNTMHAKTFKLKLTYKSPIIDEVQNMYGLVQGNKSEVKINLPTYLLENYNNYVMPFSSRTLYDQKRQIISFKFESEPMQYKKILIGFYSNLHYDVLIGYALLKVYVVEGERLRLKVGTVHKLHIPINLSSDISNRIYKIQTSHQSFVLNHSKLNWVGSHYNEPECTIRAKRPAFEKQIMLSVINAQGNLIKHYLLIITAALPSSHYEVIKLEGFQGEKFQVSVHNPYAVKLRFYLVTSAQWISFKEEQVIIEREKKISLNCRIVGSPLSNENEYILQYDEYDKVVAIYEIQFIGRMTINMETLAKQ